MKSFVIRALWLLILVALISGFARAQTEVTVFKDLVYQTVPDAQKPLCTLDVYAPKNAKNLPVLVWFHGGGFTGGDKATRATTALCTALAGEGFVVASANYRLHPAVKFPVYLEDGAAAVAWMRENAAKFGGDVRQLFIGGHSAGGYLAAMLGTDAHYLAAHNVKLSDLEGVIPLSGEMTTHFEILAERGLPEGALVVDEAAPLFHAAQKPAAAAPAFLIMWGENDMALRAEGNQLFAATLKNAGNPNVRALQIAGRDHGGMIGKMAQADDSVRTEIVAFMRFDASKSQSEAK